MKKSAYLLLVCCLSFAIQSLSAQRISWTPINDDVIPEGVSYFSGSASSGQAVKAWYVEIPPGLQNWELVPVLAQGVQSTDEIAQSYNALFAINGGFFGGGVSLSSVIQYKDVLARNVTALNRNGVALPVIRSAAVWDIEEKGRIEYVYHQNSDISGFFGFNEPLPYAENASTPLAINTNIEGARVLSSDLNALGGGPVLLKDSTIAITYNEEVFWGSGVGRDNADPRTAIGFKRDGTAILMVVDGRQSVSFGLSLPEVAAELRALGCVEAMNLDGGGSSQFAFQGQMVNRPVGSTSYRDVTSALALIPRGSLREDTTNSGIRQTIFLDTENGSFEGEWFETANDGFWGDTRSMLHSTVDVADTSAYFLYPLITDSVTNIGDGFFYNVDMWWVASSNRSQKTRVELVNGWPEGGGIIELDQTTNGSQWNQAFGGYISSFDGLGGKFPVYLKIYANTGESGRFVVADGIRFQQLFLNSIPEEDDELPVSFKISRIYPNPFNPQTTIQITLDRSAGVEFRVMNTMGQTVSTINNVRYAAGTHEISLSMGDLPTGLYFVQALFNDGRSQFTDIQKVTLIK